PSDPRRASRRGRPRRAPRRRRPDRGALPRVDGGDRVSDRVRKVLRALFPRIDGKKLHFRGGWFALPIYLVVVSMYPLSLEHADWVDIDEHFWWIALSGVLVGTLLGNGRTRVRRSMLIGAAVGTVAVVIGTTFAAIG